MAALCYDDTRKITQIHCSDKLVVALLLPTLAASWLMARRMQDSAVFSTEAWSLDQLNSANWSVESMIVNVKICQNVLYQAVLWIPEPSILMSGTGKSPSDSCILATGEVGELIAFRLSTSRAG